MTQLLILKTNTTLMVNTFYAGATLIDIGNNIRDQAIGLFLGLVVAYVVFQVAKSMGANNVTKVIVTAVLGFLVYFIVGNFDYVSGIFAEIFRTILGG